MIGNQQCPPRKRLCAQRLVLKQKTPKEAQGVFRSIKT